MPLNTDALESQIANMPMAAYLSELEKMRKAAKREPRNVQLHIVLAFMFLRTDSYDEAVRALKKAYKAAPRNEVVLKTLSELLLLQMRNYAEALKFLRLWAGIRKDVGVIHAYIANCLLQLGKPEQALTSLETAEKIEPGNPETLATRADVYVKQGDSMLARETYEQYLAVGDDPGVASALLQVPGYTPDDAVLEKISALADKAQEGTSKKAVYSNMALAYEERGDFDSAFNYFQKSNRNAPAIYENEAHVAAFRNTKRIFSREYILSHEGSGVETNQPVFIVGMPRSGTTLTESILAGHPDIIDNGELQFLHSEMSSNGLYANHNPMLSQRLPGFEDYLAHQGSDYYQRLAKRYLDLSGFRKRDKRLQVDKLPHNFFSVGMIHLAFPNAKIIHCRRHPVDCALSCYKASFSSFHSYANDLEFLGVYYKQYWDLMKHWRDVLPGKMFEICYEDVVTNTETVARGIVDHVGLDWDEGCLDHTQSKKTVKTTSQWQVRQPIYTSSVAKWKNYEEQLQPMIKTMGSCIEEYEAELAALAK